ncbi:MAG: CRR6 family NdhI maturation factor [Calothrix sp. C42_A2020_038]|nr:CRR6 family NdhI maturation factor [Calothrix sp. C42_A2020_038]
MSTTIKVNIDQINTLDISPVAEVIEEIISGSEIIANEQQLIFNIDYPREANDPRELSEIPEIRLWFVLLDTRYPWLPFLLNWQEKEFTRYAAMLVPHQFTKEGIQYNPEALEIFLMSKIFILSDWLKHRGIPHKSRLKAMAQLLGYDLEDAFFEMF